MDKILRRFGMQMELFWLKLLKRILFSLFIMLFMNLLLNFRILIRERFC